MSERHQFLDLLWWVKNLGLFPNREHRGSERFLNPFDHKVYKGRDLPDHMKNRALWIPSKRGLKMMGISCDVTKPGLYLAYIHLPQRVLVGTGPDEDTAILSCFNKERSLTAPC